MIDLNAVKAKLESDRHLPLRVFGGNKSVDVYDENTHIATIYVDGCITLGLLFRVSEHLDPHWRRVLTAVLSVVAEVEFRPITRPDWIGRRWTDCMIEALDEVLKIRRSKESEGFNEFSTYSHEDYDRAIARMNALAKERDNAA